jgi:hypothetical protein
VPSLNTGTLASTRSHTKELAEIVCTRTNAASIGILEQPMGARNLVGIGLSYRPDRLYRLAESIPWNRLLGSLKILKYRLRCDSIKNPGLSLKSSEIRVHET